MANANYAVLLLRPIPVSCLFYWTYYFFSLLFCTFVPETSRAVALSGLANRGFTSARAAHDRALIDEFIRRGIDISIIHDGRTISFTHKVALDDAGTKLILV